MTLTSYAKFEEKVTLSSKNDMRNLVNFNASREMFENLHFDMLFLSKVYCLHKKTTAELCAVTLKNDAKFEEELTCALKNGMRNMTQHFKVSKLAL